MEVVHVLNGSSSSSLQIMHSVLAISSKAIEEEKEIGLEKSNEK